MTTFKEICSKVDALATNVGLTVKDVQKKMGGLSSLSTTNKTSIVEAINEIKVALDSVKNDSVLNYPDRMKLYIQSRGQGLITNGYGLLLDNTNFSAFTPLKSDVPAGFMSFANGTYNSTAPIDETIAVNMDKEYIFSFKAKTINAAANNKAYAYIECFDVDRGSIQTHHLPVITFKLAEDWNATQPNLKPVSEDVSRVGTYLAKVMGTASLFWILDADYTSKTGLIYPRGTYSRTNLTPLKKFNETSFINGEWRGLVLVKGASKKAGDYVSIAVTGGTHIYPFIGGKGNRDLADHVIPNEWTDYTITFKPKDILRPGTATIRVGWLLNRGSSNKGNITGINGIEFYEK